MLHALKKVFRKPSATTLAQQELEDAKRELLVAQTQADHARRTVDYQQDRVTRLTSYLRNAQGGQL